MGEDGGWWRCKVGLADDAGGWLYGAGTKSEGAEWKPEEELKCYDVRGGSAKTRAGHAKPESAVSQAMEYANMLRVWEIS